jgi:hypothetical protein
MPERVLECILTMAMCLNIALAIPSGLVPAVGLKDSTPGTPESVNDSRHKMFAVRNKASSSSSSNKTATATTTAAAAAAAAAVDTTSSNSAAAAPTKRGSATSRLSRSYSRSASEA